MARKWDREELDELAVRLAASINGLTGLPAEAGTHRRQAAAELARREVSPPGRSDPLTRLVEEVDRTSMSAQAAEDAFTLLRSRILGAGRADGLAAAVAANMPADTVIVTSARLPGEMTPENTVIIKGLDTPEEPVKPRTRRIKVRK